MPVLTMAPWAGTPRSDSHIVAVLASHLQSFTRRLHVLRTAIRREWVGPLSRRMSKTAPMDLGSKSDPEFSPTEVMNLDCSGDPEPPEPQLGPSRTRAIRRAKTPHALAWVYWSGPGRAWNLQPTDCESAEGSMQTLPIWDRNSNIPGHRAGPVS